MTVFGTTPDGEPTRLIVQFARDRDYMKARLRDDAASPVSATELGYSENAPEPVQLATDGTALSEAPDEWKPVASITVTPSTVAFAWPEVASFDVYVDGRFTVASDQWGGARLHELSPDTDFAVELIERSEMDEQSTGTRMLTVRTLAEDARMTEDSDRSSLPWDKYTGYMHKTFIPEARVPALQCNYLNPAFEFGGDNRSFRTPFPGEPDVSRYPRDYRTVMMIRTHWSGPLTFTGNTDVGATTVYEHGKLVRTLYADMDNMKWESLQHASSYARAYLRHASSIPACKLWDFNYGGAITYGEWVEFYPSGTVAIDGYRYRAPAHEMYVQRGQTTQDRPPKAEYGNWGTLSRRDNEGFHCLFGNAWCPLDFYTLSGTAP